MNPLVSIIMVGHKSDWQLYRVLRSVERLRQAAGAAQITTELLVVLNRPQPSALAAVETWQREWSLDRLEVLDLSDISAVYQTGIKLAQGRYVMLTNDQDYPSANWLVTALHTIEIESPRVVVHSQYRLDFNDGSWCRQLDQQGDNLDIRALLFGDRYTGPLLVERASLDWCNHRKLFTVDAIARGYTHFCAPQTAHYHPLQVERSTTIAELPLLPAAFFDWERIFGVVTGKKLPLDRSYEPVTQPNKPVINDLLRADLQELSSVDPGVLRWRELTYQPGLLSAAAAAAADIYGWLINRWAQEANISHLFILPWLTTGGSDREVIAYIEALTNYYHQKVAVITTEPNINEWRHRLPAAVLFIDLGNQLLATAVAEAELTVVLARLLVQRQPAVLHVVGSRLGWQTLARYSRALAIPTKIFVTAFSDYYDTFGHANGYLTQYLPQIRNQLSGLITDNEFYRQRCRRLYGLSESVTHCVYPPQEPLAGVIAATDFKLKQVLWAGRLDAGKRLDLLRTVALALPDYTFYVYGQPVFNDAAGEVMALRDLANVHLSGPYQNFADVLIRPYSLLLYATERDGLPNVILEAMAAKIPVVAPNIGGITEMINEATGFLVHDSQNSDEYLQQIRAVGGNPELTRQRVNRAYRLIQTRHSRAGFTEALAGIAGYLNNDLNC